MPIVSAREKRKWYGISAIRRHWPKTHLTIRGDGQYGRPEMMDFCEAHGLDYLFGVAGTKALNAKVEDTADPIRVERAQTGTLAVGGFAETCHKAKSWKHERRVVARIEATPLGLDIRCVVTSLEAPSPEDIYAKLYCARGQAENLIKLHNPAQKRPHIMPLTSGQSDAPDPPHRRLLAYAHRRRRHPQDPRPLKGRSSPRSAPGC